MQLLALPHSLSFLFCDFQKAACSKIGLNIDLLSSLALLYGKGSGRASTRSAGHLENKKKSSNLELRNSLFSELVYCQSLYFSIFIRFSVCRRY